MRETALPLLFGSRHSNKGEICDVHAPAVADWRMKRSSSVEPSLLLSAQMREVAKRSGGEHLAREAVLLSFCNPLPHHCSRLQNLSRGEWRRLLHWLDISGLALYFLDRMTELQWSDRLPAFVLARLQENLTDNTERTRGMIAESVAIQREFQEARVSYANLKGLSLWPSSVPKPELRSQFDLDFLVAKRSAPEARRILERRGYRLYLVSGRSWEFKLNERPGVSLKDLYKALPSHAVELHIEPDSLGRPSLLERIEIREMYGCSMPVLSPVDLFLGQGLHAYKHVCGEFSRAAHLLEFRRHVRARHDDHAFWRELLATAAGNPRVSLGLGVVTLLIAHVMGDFAPEALTDWTVRQLSRRAHLWVLMYGRRTAFGGFPGSKLYLLLQRELEAAGIPAKRSLRQTLLPSRLPPPIIRVFPNEALSVRLGRYRMQLHFVFHRLRFHLVEGIRFIWESHRWQKLIDRDAR